LEFNDVFDTVKETGDHGSFNAWGRDRYWHPDRNRMNQLVAQTPEMPRWDAHKTTILRNNRWRCDHGWDIDLDDGASNYHIYDNVCLHGGLKLREGFFRTVENNIMLGNSFHPHVWFENSGDVFIHNIVGTEYFPIGMPNVWGKQVDFNVFPSPTALRDARSKNTDQHSIAGDPKFVDPSAGNFQVRSDSPAIAAGFQNFPTDQFGVMRPDLHAQARTPDMSDVAPQNPPQSGRDDAVHSWMGARIKNIVGMGEVSAYGLPDEVGVLLTDVSSSSSKDAGLQKGDVILKCNGMPVADVLDLFRLCNVTGVGETMSIHVSRGQRPVLIEVRKADSP
jgi:hypothetical protein